MLTGLSLYTPKILELTAIFTPWLPSYFSAPATSPPIVWPIKSFSVRNSEGYFHRTTLSNHTFIFVSLKLSSPKSQHRAPVLQQIMFMIFGSPHDTTKVTAWTVSIGDTEIFPSSSVRNIGAFLDPELNMRSHLNNTIRACYAQLRPVAQIRRYLTTEAASKLCMHS